MTEHDQQLATAIERLYATFARYGLKQPIPSCACCVLRGDQTVLTAAPLRELSREALEKFGSKAMSTWGGIDDYKHFLPRLLELEASGPTATLTRMSDKLVYASWRTWPAREQDAIVAYYHALAISHFSPSAMTQLLSETLEDAVVLDLDMTAFLAAWTTLKEDAAVQQLVNLASGFETATFWESLGPSAPHKGSMAWHQLRSWLLDPRTEKVLVDAYVTGKAGATVYDARQLSEIALASDQIAMRLYRLTHCVLVPVSAYYGRDFQKRTI